MRLVYLKKNKTEQKKMFSVMYSPRRPCATPPHGVVAGHAPPDRWGWGSYPRSGGGPAPPGYASPGLGGGVCFYYCFVIFTCNFNFLVWFLGWASTVLWGRSLFQILFLCNLNTLNALIQQWTRRSSLVKSVYVNLRYSPLPSRPVL